MEERKSFLLRINPALWREIEVWAQEELRSVNGQIEYLLKQAVQQRRKRNLLGQDAAATDTPTSDAGGG
jgi:hypothetical protein